MPLHMPVYIGNSSFPIDGIFCILFKYSIVTSLTWLSQASRSDLASETGEGGTLCHDFSYFLCSHFVECFDHIPHPKFAHKSLLVSAVLTYKLSFTSTAASAKFRKTVLGHDAWENMLKNLRSEQKFQTKQRQKYASIKVIYSVLNDKDFIWGKGEADKIVSRISEPVHMGMPTPCSLYLNKAYRLVPHPSCAVLGTLQPHPVHSYDSIHVSQFDTKLPFLQMGKCKQQRQLVVWIVQPG